MLRDGKVFKKQNFNFWGVTFAHDDDRIYATLGSGKESYLVQGSIKARTFRVLTTHLECPSLSPDETRIAFKQSLDSHGSWRIYVLDLKTMKRWPLAETKIGRRPGRVARRATGSSTGAAPISGWSTPTAAASRRSSCARHRRRR